VGSEQKPSLGIPVVPVGRSLLTKARASCQSEKTGWQGRRDEMRLGPFTAHWLLLIAVGSSARAAAATGVRLGGCLLAVSDGSGELSDRARFDRMSITVLDLSDNLISALPSLPLIISLCNKIDSTDSRNTSFRAARTSSSSR